MEKNLLMFYIFMCCLSVSVALKCWRCTNAQSEILCTRRGQLQTCQSNQESCFREVRRNERGLLITKGCKQTDACRNDMQNANCEIPTLHFVCRCCCSSRKCNKGSLCKKRRRVISRDEPRRQRCEVLPTLDFVIKECSMISENILGSVCKFTCVKGYKLMGSDTSTCVQNQRTNLLEFDNQSPWCKPIHCDDQIMKHGNVHCSNGNLIASQCSFVCNQEDGYELFPPESPSNVCQENEKWSTPTPCCIRPCPKYAKIDLVIILDSSSSIGNKNWIKMKEYVLNVTRKFTIGQDSARIAIIRYNAQVNTGSQILLNSIQDSRGYEDAISNIHYNGKGTMTGQALQYVDFEVFQQRNGDRNDAADVVLVITDGKSQDDVSNISTTLRDRGVLTFVLGINSARGTLNREQLLQIAGKEDHCFEARNGFSDLDETLMDKLSQKLCYSQCQRYFSVKN